MAGKPRPKAGRGPTLGSLLLVGAGLTVGFFFPRLSPYSLYVLALVAVQMVATLSLNLLMGYAGQVSLGQAALVGMGAYAVAQLAAWRVPFPLTLLAGAAATTASAALVGLPSLRIRGLQLAATTLAFGIMAERLIFARPWDPLSTAGMSVPRPPAIQGDRAFFLFALGGLATVLVLDASLRKTRFGRAFLAVRFREDTAAAWGIPVGLTKLLAYALSGLYAGIAGGMYAYLLERVSADTFNIWQSLAYVAAVVVGGLGSWRGAMVAAAFFTGLPELLRSHAVYAPLAGAVLLALVPGVWPEGLGAVVDRALPLPGPRNRGLRTPSPAPAPRGPLSGKADPVPGTNSMKAGTSEPPDGDGAGVPVAVLRAPLRPLRLSVPVTTLLRAEGVSVTFGGLEVLKGLHLEVRRGEVVGLIGPNGAGKTTFFNVFSGFVLPRAGTVTYRNLDLLSLPTHARASLGLVRTFQQVGLCREMSVLENVLLAQYSLGRYGLLGGLARLPRVRTQEAEARSRAEAAMEVMGVLELRDEKVSSLPYGKQRLVELAGAVAAGPALLLLDEPAAGMDPGEAAELARHLRDLHHELGMSLLVIEHHVPFVAEICNYVYVLNEGEVLAEGSPEEIQKDPRVVSAYLGSGALPAGQGSGFLPANGRGAKGRRTTGA